MQLKKQRLTGRVSQTMGRQRNNPQMKGKEEASERMRNEKEVGDRLTLRKPAGEKDPQRKDPTATKTQIHAQSQ